MIDKSPCNSKIIHENPINKLTATFQPISESGEVRKNNSGRKSWLLMNKSIKSSTIKT